MGGLAIALSLYRICILEEANSWALGRFPLQAFAWRSSAVLLPKPTCCQALLLVAWIIFEVWNETANMLATEEIASASLHPEDFMKSRLERSGERDQQRCSIHTMNRRSSVNWWAEKTLKLKFLTNTKFPLFPLPGRTRVILEMAVTTKEWATTAMKLKAGLGPRDHWTQISCDLPVDYPSHPAPLVRP